MKLIKEHSLMLWTAFKLFLTGVATLVLISVFILVLASTGQQSVYRNLDIDRNAYVDMIQHVLGR